VYDTEKRQPFRRRDGLSSLRQIEVFPPPDGDEIMTILPRFFAVSLLLLDILYHLAQLLYFLFQ